MQFMQKTVYGYRRAWRRLRSQTKILLVMKLTMILLTAFLFHASARSVGQNVVFSGKKVPLETVFSALEKQTGFYVLYTKNTLAGAQPVSITTQGMPLTEFLNRIFEDQPLTYTIASKTITIFSKAEAAGSYMQLLAAVAPPVPVNGLVTTEDGTPLSGAAVTIKNSKISATTNAEGRFSINAGAGDVLVISYVGYKQMEIVVHAGNDAKLISAKLSLAVNDLDETVIIGYGTTSRRMSVGSVSTVTSKDIEQQPVSNVLLALQGRVPGLVITPTGGAPGSAVKLQIRGQNTLSANQYSAQNVAGRPFDQPLFIIDGVPVATQNNSLGNLFTYGISTNSNSVIPGNGVSPFNSFNPADIESISVLRDADATSIYGSQGANGVILINTKKGKPGKPSLDITANAGFTAGTRRLTMLNTQQYLAMRKEAVANDKVVLSPSTVNNYADLQLFDSTRYTDWYKEFFDKMPVTTDVHVTFSGGQQYSSFILSGGYTHTPYNFAGDFKDDRLSLHSGYTYRSPNNKLTVQFVTDYSYTKNNAGTTPKVTAAMSMPPNYPALLDDKDNLLWYYKGLSLSFYNQYGFLRQPANIQAHTINNSIRLAYQVLQGLTVSSNIGYSRTSNYSYSSKPLASQDPGSTSTVATAAFTSGVSQAVNIEPMVDYKRVMGAGELSVLAGGTYKKQTTNSQTLQGNGYVNDDLLRSINGAATISAYSSGNLYKYVAGYARLGYIYDRKYILNLTGRRDASTNFGPGRRWGSFGSVGAGWIFTKERFWPKGLSFLSFGKLSGNYGTNGSDGVAPYQYQAYYQVDPSTTTLPFQGIRTYTANNLYNPNYSWGVKKSWNAALDMGFLNDKLLVNITWYKNSTSNQLLAYTLPDQVGFNSVTGNFPATVQNTGLEFSISATPLQRGAFKWTANFNISGNRNKLAAFKNLDKSPYATSYVIGKSVNVINGYEYAGVDKATGLFTFYNVKGQLTSTPNTAHISQGGDAHPLFSTDPSFNGGLGNTFTYKSFSLTVFMQFAKQRGRNWIAGLYGYGLPGNYLNIPVEALDHWRKPGDESDLQRLTVSLGAPYRPALAFANSTGAYSDASYVRVKTVSFAWSLPQRFTRKAGITNCRLYCNAQNLFTITGYKVADPEMAGTLYAIPLQRNVVAGISVNF
jgi:TonB-linked SusC/RagA family outer membrane protein